MRAGTLGCRPYIPMLEERNARTGFFDTSQFDSPWKRLPSDIQPVAKFAYITGWRVPTEVLPLQWRQVDFIGGTVSLDPGTTKNREGRTFVMTAELRTLLETQRDHTKTLERSRDKIIRWVFSSVRKADQGLQRHMDGRVQVRRPARADPSRLPSYCRSESGAGRRPRARGDDHDGAQDTLGVREIQYRQRRRSEGRRAKARCGNDCEHGRSHGEERNMRQIKGRQEIVLGL